MYRATYDYYTAEKQHMERIEKELAARSAETLAVDEEAARLSFQKIMEKYKQHEASHKRIPTEKRYSEFLCISELMREYTALHNGKITIRAEEGGLGVIEMSFDYVIHSELDSSHSHRLLGLLFRKYEQTNIFAVDGCVVIQVYQELYDEINTDSQSSGNSPAE